MVERNRQLFEPGRCVVTPAAEAALEAVGLDATALIRRHVSGDWGDHGLFEETTVTETERRHTVFATDDDAKLNRLAVEQNDGSRVMSQYRLDDGTRVWVSTEGTGEHRQTVVMLPSEY